MQPAAKFDSFMVDDQVEKAMFSARSSLWIRFRFIRSSSFCSNARKNNDKVESSVSTYEDAYKKLDKLDFMTAAKILFTDPPKKKKFGYSLLYLARLTSLYILVSHCWFCVWGHFVEHLLALMYCYLFWAHILKSTYPFI